MSRAEVGRRWGPQTEQQWQAHVLQLLCLAGFERHLIYHTYSSRRSQPGFPDLIALRVREWGREVTLLAVELKTDRGKVTDAQTSWVDAFGALALLANGRTPRLRVITGVWRPQDRERIWQELSE